MELSPWSQSCKVFVLYSPKYLDALAACWVFKRGLQSAQFVASEPDQVPEGEIPDGVSVIIIGFCYPNDVLRQLAARSHGVRVFCHHKTTIERIREVQQPMNIEFNTDFNFSVARLAFNHMNNAGVEVPKFIMHIEDRTFWRFKHDQTNNFFMGLISRGVMQNINRAFQVFDDLANEEGMVGGPWWSLYDRLLVDGRVLNEYKMAEVERIVEGKRYKTVAGHKVPVVNAPKHLVSEVGNILAKGELFSVCYHDIGEDRHFHLRSLKQEEGGFDVSAIAVCYGGGGQRTAAAFKLPLSHDLVRLDFKKAEEKDPIYFGS